MSGSTSKKKWVRVSASGSEAGAGVAMTLQAPFCGWIRRARVVGPGGSNLTLNVSETLAGTGSFDIVLAYGSAATPIDEEESPGVFYDVPKTDPSNPMIGTMYLSATSSVNGAVSVQLDIEPAF